jgi:hypothetical protein
MHSDHITALDPAMLAKYKRVHLFSGIGGWELACQLAGWPDNWPLWTASCPCQPFSQAGKRKGNAIVPQVAAVFLKAFIKEVMECAA